MVSCLKKNLDATFAELEQSLQAEYKRRQHRIRVQEHSLIAATPFRRNEQFWGARDDQFRGGRTRGRGRSGYQGRNNYQPRGINRRDNYTYCNRRGYTEPQCYIKIVESEIKSMTINQLKDVQSRIKDIKGLNPKTYVSEGQERIHSEGSDIGSSALTVEALMSALETPPPIKTNSWILDSGASSHISNDKDNFSEISRQSPTTNVLTANGSKMPHAGAGCINISGNKTISDVLYVPSVTRNLLSVGKLADQGHKILFNSKYCYVFDSKSPYKLQLNGIRNPRNRLYPISPGSSFAPVHDLSKRLLPHLSLLSSHDVPEPVRLSQHQLWH